MSVRHLLVLVLLASTASARAAPNESCEEAQIIALGVATLASTDDLTSVQDATSCGVDDEYALWFRFTAPTTDPYVVTTIGSTLDTTLALYDGCGGELLACNDDALQDLTSEQEIWFEEGQVVYLRVAGWGSQKGDIVVRVDDAWHRRRQANDDCADAVEISIGHPGVADTTGATGTDLSSCGPEDSVDLWYTFTAPTAGKYDFSLTQQLISAHYISVHSSCAATDELGCGFFGTSAELAENQKVYLRIGTNPIVADHFNVNVGPLPDYPVPPNDHHLGALPVSVPSTTVGTTRGADRESMNWGVVCGAYVNKAVWYSFEAPADGVYIFDTNGSAMEDTVVAIFAQCDEQGEVVPHLWECNDNDGVDLAGRLEGFLEAGTKVCLAVAGRYLSEEGEFRLNVSTPLPAPNNDQCAKAARLDIGDPVYAQNYSATPEAPTSAMCPFGEFALWYRFIAPADGVYKFDVKASRESSPDIALYDDCGEETLRQPLACDTNPWPALHLDMVEGQEVRVRVATDVFWRSIMAVRVTPLREPPEVVEEDPVVEAVELAPEVSEPTISEPDETEPAITETDSSAEDEDVGAEMGAGEEADARAEASAEVEARGAVEGGCGCNGASTLDGLGPLLATLALTRSRTRARARSHSRMR